MAVPGVNLTAIRAKVRRITKMPSENQISDVDLDDYINTFYLYDFPEHLRLLNLKETFTLTTEPNVDIYNFTPNTFVSLEPPAYIQGVELRYSQSRAEFFSMFPEFQRNQLLDTGDGTVGPYNGTITGIPVKRNRVIISTVDVNGNSLTATDTTAGTFTGEVVAGSTINYITGVIAALTWTTAIPAAQEITVQSINYQAARPQAVLFYDDRLQFMPVPDQAYQFQIDAFRTPTSLVNATDEPEIREWWQLLALGGALKIFADRLDMESYSKANILFNIQKRLVERRTLKQLSNQRVATIYTDSFRLNSPLFSGRI